MSTVFFGVTTRAFHYSHTIGRQEFSGPGFRAPNDLALGPDGLIYVLNRSWEPRPEGVRVTMFTVDEEYLGEFARFGKEDGELVWPISIALDSSQNVYIADEWLNRISKFDKDGEFLDKWGVAGSDDGQLKKPSGIRFDKEDNLYVVDSGNSRVQKFTKDGRYLAQWGQAGHGEGQFNLPWGIAIDNNGDVYVADWRNDRVQKFTADGRFLAEFGSAEPAQFRSPHISWSSPDKAEDGSELRAGAGVGEFSRPTGVAVDKDGDIYVADWGNDRVQVLTSDGRYITTFLGNAGLSKWGADKINANPSMIVERALVRDTTPEQRMWRPTAVAVDDQGRIMILDTNRTRMQIYQKENY